jgi:hypothetical protein
MTDSNRPIPADPTAVIVALYELIEALDRRIPDVERVGESHIREQAAELRAQATRRIQALAEADADARALYAALSNAVMTDDGAPVPAGGMRDQEKIDGSS